MKKLLIFLLLFSFGFAGYCAPLYDGPEVQNATLYSSLIDMSGYSTYPAGNYILVVREPNSAASAEKVLANNPETAIIYNFTLTPDRIFYFSGGTYYFWADGADYQIFSTTDDPPSPPVITSAISLNKIAGTAFTYNITATGDPTITYGASNLPAGFTFNGSTITGTVPSSNFSFDISATNSGGSDSKTVNVTVTAGVPPSITSSLTVSANAGQSFSYTITATGTPVITYGASNLPSFLSFNGSTVSGTIPIGQTVDFSFGISATNELGSDSQTVVVHAIPSGPPIITSPLTADGVVGEFFSYTVTVTGSTPITIESFTGTTWLTLNGSILSGIHPGGSYPTEVTARLTATNAFGIDVKTLVISFLKQGIPVITSPLSVGITPGQAFSYTITATGDPVITFGASGLPAYLSYSNGVVSGIIPTDVTNFGFIISATNSLGTDTKTVTASVGGGGGTGIVDTDDDVPAINEVKAEVIKGWTQFGILWAQFITNYMEPLRTIGVDIGDDLEIYHLEKMEILSLLDSKFSLLNDAIIDVIAPMIIGIKEDTQIIQPDVATIKTNVIEINDKLTNIEAVINTLNTDTGIRLESIKGVLDASLIVQQNQLTTQESILVLLDQIANPPADPPPPLMPDTPENPVTPNYAVDFTFDKTDNSGELQEYNKTFSMFDTAFAQRDGTLPFVLVIPLSKISSLLDDVQIDFSDGVVGSLVSGLRAILASILFYITLKYWFLAVRRITD